MLFLQGDRSSLIIHNQTTAILYVLVIKNNSCRRKNLRRVPKNSGVKSASSQECCLTFRRLHVKSINNTC